MSKTTSADPTDVALGIPPPENKIFYPALDGLRAFAALIVFFQHYLLFKQPVHVQWGWSGVDIFFVLSGFLITGILYDTRDTAHRFHNFYIRRTLRIFPLYYGIFAIVLLLTPVFQWNWQHIWLLWTVYLGNYSRFVHPENWIRFGGTVDNLISRRFNFQLYFGHFWSLCVEEQFYLVWPPIVFALRDRVRLRNLCFAAAIILPGLRLWLNFALPRAFLQADILYRTTPVRVDALLIGGALALMLRGPEGDRLRRLAVPILLGSTAAIIFGYLAALVLFHQHHAVSIQSPWMNSFGFTFIDIAAAAVILLSLRPGNLIYRLFTIQPLRRLGQVSYGFYVFHDLPHVFYRHLVRTLPGIHPAAVDLVTAALALVCTTTLAFLSFRYFEAPFLRLKDRFTI